jgi:hypothetical protein
VLSILKLILRVPFRSDSFPCKSLQTRTTVLPHQKSHTESVSLGSICLLLVFPSHQSTQQSTVSTHHLRDFPRTPHRPNTPTPIPGSHMRPRLAQASHSPLLQPPRPPSKPAVPPTVTFSSAQGCRRRDARRRCRGSGRTLSTLSAETTPTAAPYSSEWSGSGKRSLRSVYRDLAVRELVGPVKHAVVSLALRPQQQTPQIAHGCLHPRRPGTRMGAVARLRALRAGLCIG